MPAMAMSEPSKPQDPALPLPKSMIFSAQLIHKGTGVGVVLGVYTLGRYESAGGSHFVNGVELPSAAQNPCGSVKPNAAATRLLYDEHMPSC